MKNGLIIPFLVFACLSSSRLLAQTDGFKKLFVPIDATNGLALGINDKPAKTRYSKDSFKQIADATILAELPDSLKSFKWAYIQFSQGDCNFYVVFNNVGFFHQAMLLCFNSSTNKFQSALLIEESGVAESSEFSRSSKLKMKEGELSIVSEKKSGFTTRCKPECLCTDYTVYNYQYSFQAESKTFKQTNKTKKNYSNQDCDE